MTSFASDSDASSADSVGSTPAADFFTTLEQARYGDVHLMVDEATQLRAIIAIHSTALGPALGGCRFIHYDTGAGALHDALRLARGMTYKSALAGLPFGGGKAVLMHPGTLRDREALMHAYGRFVNSLGGRYITAVDSGTSVEDMDIIATETGHVTCTSSGTGDASPYTADGVVRGIEAAARFCWGRDSLEGVHVAIQGVGHVGSLLARALAGRGARLTLADIDTASAAALARQLGASVADAAQVLETECDVLSPCALGGVLNAETVPRLAAAVVAGAANNQLATDADGDALHARGIVYVPDYIINAGGVIGIAPRAAGRSRDEIGARVSAIHDTVLDILNRAGRENRPPAYVADAMAEEIVYGHALD